ncbi:deoxyribonuclease V [Candidatus Methylomirabilis sp.]|uniref:deoxyribonuclease V n=1 Tax=Candidatus Methylomirabilis sp. TaxID=2032687 RepID=UPI002A6182E7|nr:deoxyribonuclease V [Candidatus Methylomirabilis sp.]
MRNRTLHRWDVSPQEAVAIQLMLRPQLCLHGTGPFATVAGVDVAYDATLQLMFAGAVVMSDDGHEMLDFATATASVDFPYIPGLLSFREIPAVIKAWNRLKTSADCLICDGHGLAHPRRFGLACHLGLMLDLPSIGCAKSRLVGTHREPRTRRGSVAPLLDHGEQIGVVLRTKDGVAPVFISQGDRIGLDAAVQTVLATCRGYRLPEPQRRAHLLVTKMRLAARP